MPHARALLIAMLDADVSDEEDFNRWYDEEHIRDRLECPGFISARRFEVVDGSPKYLTIYELESPESLESAEYRALFASPSERTKRMVAGMKGVVRSVYIERGEPRYSSNEARGNG
jgi:hypothetical protein